MNYSSNYNTYNFYPSLQNNRQGRGAKWKKILSFAVLSAVTLTACNYDTRASGRSGTYQDDYLENPIDKEFVQYENALAVSNEILDLMKAGDSKKIADDYVLEELKLLLTEDQIDKMIKGAEAKYGKIVSYKPMQWGFEPRVENGKRDKSEFNKIIAEKYGNKKAAKKIPILFSVKIVEHEKGLVNYWFQFPSDGKYEKVLGIFYKEKKGTRNVGQFG